MILKICHLNIEEIFVKDEDAVRIAIQENHTSSDVNFHQHGIMTGYKLIDAIHSSILHAIETFAKKSLADCLRVDLRFDVNEITIVNVYRPPSQNQSSDALFNFNSHNHNQTWGYEH
jgi:hypothetical protein